MKQYITVDQAKKELKDKYEEMTIWIEERGYRDWQPEKYDPNGQFITIGQMIEFLYDNRDKRGKKLFVYSLPLHGEYEHMWISEDFCDTLWEAVKEVLKITVLGG